MLRVEHRALDHHDELARLQLKNGPFLSVGCDADKMLLFFALSIREVIRHSSLNVLPFSVEIALGFEDGATN